MFRLVMRLRAIDPGGLGVVPLFLLPATSSGDCPDNVAI
jgi:hypothetical protein